MSDLTDIFRNAVPDAKRLARLESAGQEMFVLLKKVIEPLGRGGYHPDLGAPLTQKIRDVIAKIEG